MAGKCTEQVADNLTRKSELALKPHLEQVNHELNGLRNSCSATEYGKMLNRMEQTNAGDRQANPHLPKLDLYSTDDSKTPNAVKPNFSGSDSQAGNTSGPTNGKPVDQQIPSSQVKPEDNANIHSPKPDTTGIHTGAYTQTTDKPTTKPIKFHHP